MARTLMSSRMRIQNTWITDALSEVLSTFILAIFVIGSAAHFVLSQSESSSVTARNLTGGMGLCFAVYVGGKASGASANPIITLAFCALGRVKWKKYALYTIAEVFGAILAAGCVYAVHKETLHKYGDGQLKVYGANATAQIFCSFPTDGVSNLAAFYEVVISSALLTGLVIAITDPRNAAPDLGFLPVPLGLLVFSIATAFSFNSGAPINPAIDFGARCFAAAIGYGSEMFSRDGYYFWIPIVGDMLGATVAIIVYQLFIGYHLGDEDDTLPETKQNSEFQKNIQFTQADKLRESPRSTTKSYLDHKSMHSNHV